MTVEELMAMKGVLSGRPPRPVQEECCRAECPGCGVVVPLPEYAIRETAGPGGPQTEYVCSCGGVAVTIDPIEPDGTMRSYLFATDAEAHTLVPAKMLWIRSPEADEHAKGVAIPGGPTEAEGS